MVKKIFKFIFITCIGTLLILIWRGISLLCNRESTDGNRESVKRARESVERVKSSEERIGDICSKLERSNDRISSIIDKIRMEQKISDD